MIKIQMPNATQAQQAYAHAHVVAHAQQQAAQQAREHRERQVRHLLSRFGLEICCSRFSKISHFLEGILMEYIDKKNSLDSRL